MDNGNFQTFSRLQEDFYIDLVDKLKKPDGRVFKTGKDGIIVDLDKITTVEQLFDAMNSVLEQPSDRIAFVHNQSNNDLRFTARQFLKYINKHSTTELTNFAKEAALKNAAVEGILNVTYDPENQLNASVPINMNDQQEAKTNSKLGKDELYVTADSPATKYMMQVQNMAGKEVIGITAVSLKTFFAVSTYFNVRLHELKKAIKENNADKIFEILDSLIIQNKLKSDYDLNRITTIANLNYDLILDVLKDRTNNTFILSERDLNKYPDLAKAISMINSANTIINYNKVLELDTLIKHLSNISSRSDAALAISGLLSSATDNAKELILSKINATAKFVDIYTYLLSIDVPFLDIADFMQSAIFNKIVGLTETNIFDVGTSKNDFKKALGFYLNLGILPNISMSTFRKFLSQQAKNQNIENYPKNILDLISWTPSDKNGDRLNIDKALEFAWENSKKTYSKSDENYEDLDPQIMEEFALQQAMDEGQEGSGTDTSGPLTYLDYREIAKFLENVKLRNEFMNKYISSNSKANYEIKILKSVHDNIIPAMEEMELLGSMLGINQGMRTDDYGMYSYIKRIENFVNKRYNEQKGVESYTEFNLMQFLNNPDYQLKQIDQYNSVKTSYNILDVITRVPHFASMFNTLYTNNYCLNNFSVSYQLERKIADDLIKPFKGRRFKTSKLSESEFKEVQKYVNDVFIVNWLREKDLSIKIPSGSWYFNGNKSDMSIVPEGQIHELKLDSVYGIASFLYYMDNYAIPAMKADERLANNAFIQNLNKTAIGDDKRGTKTTFYRLPLNMMQIDSSQNTISLYESILSDFDTIAGDSFGDWKIGDLFYLYNLIKNKDSFGQNSLTRLFENLIHSKNQTLLVNDYNQKISEWDNDFALRETISYDLEDIKHRIHEKVPESKIEPTDTLISMSEWDPSYFTFNMPIFSDTGLSIVSENAAKYESRYKGSRSFDSKEALISVCNRLSNSKIPIHMVDAVELEELIKSDSNIANSNVHAFINNGEVYVLIDRAKPTDVIHEYIHIIMATMKHNDANRYYTLMDAVKTHPKFDKYAKLYPNSHGSDLQEEVLCKVIQDYLSNLVDIATKNWMDLSNFSNDLATAISQFLGMDEFYTLRESLRKTKLYIPQSNDVYGKVMGEDYEEMTDVISMGMSSFIEVIEEINYQLLSNSEYRDTMYDPNLIKLNQKVATIKDLLIKQSELLLECN